jgi:hypothetical protein
MNEEKIYDVNWEGPFKWEKVEKYIRACHVLYQIYGAHHLYGRDVLLYIGLTARPSGVRLREHSIGKFTTWEDWEQEGDYEKAAPGLVQRIEELLIYAHQPAYNTKSKSGLVLAEGIRIFNTGRLGQLFPEVSYKYFWGEEKTQKSV